MEMLAAPIGLFAPRDMLQIGCRPGRAGADTEGEMTPAMRAADNCRSSLAYRRPIQGNVMFAAFGRSRW